MWHWACYFSESLFPHLWKQGSGCMLLQSFVRSQQVNTWDVCRSVMGPAQSAVLKWIARIYFSTSPFFVEKGLVEWRFSLGWISCSKDAGSAQVNIHSKSRAPGPVARLFLLFATTEDSLHCHGQGSGSQWEATGIPSTMHPWTIFRQGSVNSGGRRGCSLRKRALLWTGETDQEANFLPCRCKDLSALSRAHVKMLGMLVRPYVCSFDITRRKSLRENFAILWILQSFCPLFHNVPWAWGEGVILQMYQLELDSMTVHFDCGFL